MCCLILITINHEHAKERKKYFVNKCFKKHTSRHTDLTTIRTNQSGLEKSMKYVHNNRVVSLQVI